MLTEKVSLRDVSHKHAQFLWVDPCRANRISAREGYLASFTMVTFVLTVQKLFKLCRNCLWVLFLKIRHGLGNPNIVIITSFINIWNVGNREPVQSCPAFDIMVWEVPKLFWST